MKQTFTVIICMLIITLGVRAQETAKDLQKITEEEKIRLYEQTQDGADRSIMQSLKKHSKAYDPLLDEVLNVPDFNLPAGGTLNFVIPAGNPSTGDVIGFTFIGTVSGITGNSTWASDMRMIITSPAGEAFNVGGLVAPRINNWSDWQGSASTNDGTYESQHLMADNGDPVFVAGGTPDQGNWAIRFDHEYDHQMNWTDVTITLHKAEEVPVPVRSISIVIAITLITGFVLFRRLRAC